MKKVFALSLATLALLALTAVVGATEPPGLAPLTFDSNQTEIQDYRTYADNLHASEWQELSALGELAQEMAQALELGDPEAFVAAKAVMDYRVGKLSDDLQLELLRVRLGVECSCPRVADKGCGDTNQCTSDTHCMEYCGPPLGGSCSSLGYCTCN